jgi:transposase
MTNKHKTYNPAFRTQAIQLARSPGNTIKSTAQNLGIGYSTLTKWLAEEKGQQPRPSRKPVTATRTPNASIQALEEEVRRLKRENEVLRQEREILKSAAKFFAKESR